MSQSRRDLTIVGVFVVWLTGVLTLDAGAGPWAQRALGAASWIILLALLRGEQPAVRAQVAVVVVFATAVEFTASPFLGLYTYRLHNVPAFVPPGHGGTFLAALALARSPLFRVYGRMLVRFALLSCAAWALWGLLVTPRRDVLGFILFLLFLTVVARGRKPSVYASTFILTAILEVMGTSLGNWAWALRDPTDLVSIGNPPSGIAGGYVMLDMVAMRGGPVLQLLFQRLSRPTSISPLWARFRPLPP
ncbi:MAG: hypothetical protein AB1762_12585 [Gemmatimonadota bacterium]